MNTIHTTIKEIPIHTDMILLPQLLKLADVLQSGGQIRQLLAENRITVNGELCQVKRKKLYIGDVVAVKGIGTYKLTGE